MVENPAAQFWDRHLEVVIMEWLEQLTQFSLIGEKQIAACVDYQTCDRCGFRLVRVETTIINEQHITVKHCPICEMFDQEHPGNLQKRISKAESQPYFDIWLETHRLSRDALDQHYRLKFDDFFELA